MNKNGYDERQILNRYKIGFQSFFILLFLVLIDGFVRDAGYEWASPLNSTLIIIYIALTYFTLRAINCDAYFSTKNAGNSNFVMTIFSITAAFLVLVSIVKIAQGSFAIISKGQLTDHATSLLLTVYFVTTAVTYWIRRTREKRLEHNI